jgi:hypothetical protein
MTTPALKRVNIAVQDSTVYGKTCSDTVQALARWATVTTNGINLIWRRTTRGAMTSTARAHITAIFAANGTVIFTSYETTRD